MINIVLSDGDPDSIRTAEIANATIRAVAFRRGQLDRVSATLRKPGAYLLYGQHPTNSGSMIYIGESEDVAARLRFHKSDNRRPKEYWEDTIAIVSQTDDLTKSHARFLEATLISLAMNKIGWSVANEKLTNGKPPKAVTLPIADTIKMNEIVEQVKVLVRTLGCDLFRVVTGQLVTSPTIVVPDGGDVSPEFRFTGEGFDAFAVVSSRSGYWIIKANSVAKLNASDSLSPGVKSIRQQLIEAGKLVEVDGRLVFPEDCTFKSASTAASLVSGSPRNGKNKAWKLASGKTFGEWESERTAVSVAATAIATDGLA